MRLVVVDDDPPILRVLEEVGKDCGFEVWSTAEGAAVMELVSSHQPTF